MRNTILHPQGSQPTIEELLARMNALERSDNRFAQQGGNAVVYDSNGRISQLSATYILAGTLDASVVNVTNLNASNISTGTLNANRIGAASITASKLSVSTLSAIAADLGTITAGSITGVTITGSLVRTSSSGIRVQLNNSTNALEFLNSAGGTAASFITNGTSQIAFTGSMLFATGSLDMDLGSIADAILIGAILGNAMSANGNSITSVNRIEGDSGYIDFNESGRIQVNQSFDPASGSTYALGGSSRYWQDVHTVNITKYEGGSWGFFDRGVEMQDGRVLSDTEAILAMEENLDQINSYGATTYKLDSLPKVMRVKPKNKETGEVLEKDENGEYFSISRRLKRIIKDKDGKYKKEYEDFKEIHKEGEDVFATISILLGAIRELTLRVKALESAS